MALKPLTLDSGETLTCRHAPIWPPGRAVFLDESFEAQRDSGDITTEEYERLKTWQRVCGLPKMSPSKCPECPLALNEQGGPYIETASRYLPFATRKTR